MFLFLPYIADIKRIAIEQKRSKYNYYSIMNLLVTYLKFHTKSYVEPFVHTSVDTGEQKGY